MSNKIGGRPPGAGDIPRPGTLDETKEAQQKAPAQPEQAATPKEQAPVDKFERKGGAVGAHLQSRLQALAGKTKKTVAKEIDFEDLVEYGMIGLLEAADRYDPKFGANFMTFAYYRIRGAIYDGLRGMGWMSRSEYAKARFEERANEFLS